MVWLSPDVVRLITLSLIPLCVMLIMPPSPVWLCVNECPLTSPSPVIEYVAVLPTVPNELVMSMSTVALVPFAVSVNVSVAADVMSMVPVKSDASAVLPKFTVTSAESPVTFRVMVTLSQLEVAQVKSTVFIPPVRLMVPV